jgi:hypothetical protein
MDYILCILIAVLIIIIIMSNCDEKENFQVEAQFKPLISTFLNGKYTLEDFIDSNKNKFIKFKLYNDDNNYAKIIEYEDNFKIKYYYIYINNLILSYVDLGIDNNYNLKLMIPDNEAINGLFSKYRLYKNPNDKLFFIINETFKYLSIDTITNYLNITEDESKAIAWSF